MFAPEPTEYDFSVGNWLYGPKVERFPRQGPDGSVRVRSVVLDMDTVIEIGAILKRWSGGTDPTFTLVSGGEYGDRTVAESDLNALPAEDRARLMVRVIGQEEASMDGLVTFHSNPMVSVPSATVRDKIVEKLLNNRPRIKWALVTRLVPLALPLALVGLWIWLEVVQAMPAPAHAIGWVFLAGLFVAVAKPIYARRRTTVLGPGHRIRMESRAQTIARRADEKKNVKVAAITTVVTVPITIVLTSLFGFVFH
ncbi:hypothetical protein QUG92_15700 [Curtobacterium sp. RHCKG23]|uniref:Uncharacterized protein n=1 Tax=Curtobacterium citri TaxID=3055139 RepID=A0ABT7TAE3_9MICO|nr:hypothetical protein [Curtobacterium citri]MDM7886555.1 hypothetical protein [Curtobacterium citri]